MTDRSSETPGPRPVLSAEQLAEAQRRSLELSKGLPPESPLLDNDELKAVWSARRNEGRDVGPAARPTRASEPEVGAKGQSRPAA